MGHSLGGMVTLMAAEQNPGLFAAFDFHLCRHQATTFSREGLYQTHTHIA